MRPLIYAHRGSSERFAEHTRAAYLQAIADGADGVECDVHLTADLQLVLLHDATLERTSNGTGPVSGFSLAQLRTLDFSSWKGAVVPEAYGGPREQLLTLAELVALLRGAGREIGLAIEFKHPSPFGTQPEEQTLALLRSQGWLPETSVLENITISFMSFNPESLQQLARSVPGRFLCQLVAHIEGGAGDGPADGGTASEAQLGTLRLALAEGERMLDDGRVGLAGPGIEYLRGHPDRVQRWGAAGTRVRVWTVDTREELDLCLRMGVQELTTNRPAELRALLP
ncbi:MAG TPA: glycerophosphodiester phosphodiesterase family protein [Micrococcaceae bacterium]|jgi:glycerophosphoryl diester phosphodiesterase|nr:glycerophosphodiester phosphodiesterase family protein [Micrococcaceae bacterium]